MARFPGTERHDNRAGYRPGEAVRCRRSRANAALGVADRHGLVAEVRPGHVRVLLDLTGGGEWLPNGSLLPDESPPDGLLARIGRAAIVLRAEALLAEDSEFVLSCEGFDASALDEARALLGASLLSCALQSEGVHRFAVRLTLSPDGRDQS